MQQQANSWVPGIEAEYARAELRSEQDSLGKCNKNRLLAAAECFAQAAIRLEAPLNKGQSVLFALLRILTNTIV